jgi:hypothetical protein
VRRGPVNLVKIVFCSLLNSDSYPKPGERFPAPPPPAFQCQCIDKEEEKKNIQTEVEM